MGGKDTSRGIYYQALVSVLESFEEPNWDMISVEFETDKDKVDIALLSGENITKAIQVKSSINTFCKDDVVNWLNEMYDDLSTMQKEVKEYQVCLIGVYDKNVKEFANAIDKYFLGNIDGITKKQLKNFDIEKYGCSKLSIKCLHFELNSLKKIINSELHKYFSSREIYLKYQQISIMQNNITNLEMQLSTQGNGISRNDFENKINIWLYELKEIENKELKKISIRSFLSGTEQIHKEADYRVCCLDLFNHRELKEGLSWNDDVCSCVLRQLKTINDTNYLYEIHINALISIAFAVGRFLNSKKGFEIYPVQRVHLAGLNNWKINKFDKTKYQLWSLRYDDSNIDSNEEHFALIINVNKNIKQGVQGFLDQNQMKIPIIELRLSNQFDKVIENGNHAIQLAYDIINILNNKISIKNNTTLHIFMSAPVSFVFYLGNISLGLGKCIIYEYDFEKLNGGGYCKAIEFPNKYEFF